MAIAIALIGFNDLGRPVTPTFLFRNRFYLQLSTHFTIKVNVKKQRRFDRSTVIFKLKSKNFCMRLNVQSIIKMLMRY